MRKGLIILGGQGVGKTRLAESIATMYKAKDVSRWDATDQFSLQIHRRLNIIDGVTAKTPFPLTIRRPYSAEPENIKPHRYILISNILTEKDVAQSLDVFNVITLK